MADRKSEIMTGNDACVRGAIAAGMRFFAGYPITPATEISEQASELLPKCGGKYIQMEDEIASMAAIIGASFAGAKSMTATSGPGISLMQENIGFGILAEVPCVIVDVMRQGPCQGVATIPAQGDFMQSRWGTHSDHPMITVVPCSVPEIYFETVRAFNLSERFRTPVIILSDAILAHMSEKITLPEPGELEIINRIKPDRASRGYMPYAPDERGIPPMATFGDGNRWFVSGIIHDERGFPDSGDPQRISSLVTRLHSKVNNYLPEIEKYEEYRAEDADVLLIAAGVVARSVKAAVDSLRLGGIKAGLFRPVTLWPFPEARLRELAKNKRLLLTCEMNEGQLYGIARQYAGDLAPGAAITQNNGRLIEAGAIAARAREAIENVR